ncbi:MAG TPA: hypothetical protein PLZ84_03980, partial [Clostridia bacterium]|nr:hypothetical protein [Clostridia bacterium]
ESVVVAGMLTMRSSTLDLLNEFAAKGGKLVIAGKPPEYIDAVKSDAAVNLPAIFTDIEHIAAELADSTTISVTDAYGNNIDEIYAQVRADGNETIVMLLNISREKAYKRAQIKLPYDGFIERWDARTGEIFSLECNAGKVEWDFEPTGELLIVIKPENRNCPRIQTRQVIKSIPA